MCDAAFFPVMLSSLHHISSIHAVARATRLACATIRTCSVCGVNSNNAAFMHNYRCGTYTYARTWKTSDSTSEPMQLGHARDVPAGASRLVQACVDVRRVCAYSNTRCS